MISARTKPIRRAFVPAHPRTTEASRDVRRDPADLAATLRDLAARAHRAVRAAARCRPRPPTPSASWPSCTRRSSNSSVPSTVKPRETWSRTSRPSAARSNRGWAECVYARCSGAPERELSARTLGWLTVWEREAPPAIGSGDGTPSDKGIPAQPVVSL